MDFLLIDTSSLRAEPGWVIPLSQCHAYYTDLSWELVFTGVRARNPLRNGIVCILLGELVSGGGRVGRVSPFLC